MSSTVKAGLVFGIAAVAASVGAVLLPFGPVNYFVALISLVALGWGAGYTAAKSAPPGTGRGIGRGATAGALAGIVVLIVSVIAFALIANIEPFRSALRDAMEQTPQINEPGVNPVVAANLTGAGAGFCLGLINLVLLTIGGIAGGLTWRGVPSVGNTGDGGYGASDDPSARHT